MTTFNLSDSIVVSLEGRVTVAEKRTLRALSYQMLPQYVFEAYPTFVEFAETFLDFIEKRYSPDGLPNPGPYHILKNLVNSTDIDETELEFVQLLKIKLGRDLPAVTRHDLRSFLKHIKDFYRSKGTERSIQFFFRSVFNTYSSIYLPKVDLIRASYSTWYVPYVTKFKYLGGAYLNTTELNDLFDASLYGQTSKQTAWLGALNGSEQIELLAYSGEFADGETVTVTKANGNTIDLWMPLGDLQFLPGQFLTDDGMPSSSKRVQDSFYWQEFSYEISSPNSISDIVNPLVMNVHPSGFKIFAKVTEENAPLIDLDEGNDIEIIRCLNIIVCNLVPTHIGETDEIEVINLPKDFIFSRFSQVYIDQGQFNEEENSISFSSIYDTRAFDGFTNFQIENSEPQYGIFATFGGLKLPAGNESIPGSLNDGARALSYSKQVASIGFGGWSIESLADVPIEKADIAFVRTLQRRNPRSEVLTPPSNVLGNLEFTFTGTIPVDADWSNLSTTGKRTLVFKDGKLQRCTNIFPSTKTPKAIQLVVDGFSTITVNAFTPTDVPPLFEILYLKESELAKGTHTYREDVTVKSNSLTNAIVPVSPYDCLLFVNGLYQMPFRDFNIDASVSPRRITLRGFDFEVGDSIELVVLRSRQNASTSVTPMVGPDETYFMNRPVDAPMEIVQPKLMTNIWEAINWFSFEESTIVAGPAFSSVHGSNGNEAEYTGSKFKPGPFDSVKCFSFEGSSDEIDMQTSFDLLDFIPVADEPFTINIWMKFSDVGHDQTVYYFGESKSTSAALLNASAYLNVAHDTGEYKLQLSSSDSTTLTTVETALGSVVPDVWYMVTVRYDGFDIILNVMSLENESVVRIEQSDSVSGVIKPSDGNAAKLGLDGVDANKKFYGQMAHLGLWNVCLRNHDLTALFGNGQGLDKPVRYI